MRYYQKGLNELKIKSFLLYADTRKSVQNLNENYQYVSISVGGGGLLFLSINAGLITVINLGITPVTQLHN